MAGILFEWIDGFRLLDSGQSTSRHIAARNHANWREQLIGIVGELHRRGALTLGVGISPLSITIDRNDGHAWLTGFMNCEVSEGCNATDGNELDRRQIQLVFDRWLSAEIEGSPASDPEGIMKGVVTRWVGISDSQR
ncbi:hypothetical protein ETB97_000036 [Aspergillus alliaceus]|uniref:Uncharacterized protein n=1 Tax=Petromyces alliaceus TaxID=209559 RepID=A0A8H6AGN2_PETAA|nr:hypothetical protein ETB97_000036 [Aspergillus burnettii]